MGLIHRGIPQEIALDLRNRFDLWCFVETGTFKGKTALWAEKHFSRVYSVEIDYKLWQEINSSSKWDNIWFLWGDSRKVLTQIILWLDRPALFWLDAHWSRDLGYTRPEAGECPVLDEITQINKSSLRHVIMIDDARLFVDPPPKPHRVNDWPDIVAVDDLLNRGPFKRIIEIKEDVIIATPEV